jgi:hypothetical protein
MKRALGFALALSSAALAVSGASGAARSLDSVTIGQAKPNTAVNFRIVGHAPLFNRGMNAAIAVYRNFVYVGDRTDNSAGHSHPGVLIVDAADPRHPHVVGRIGPPLEDSIGQTARELRVWPQKHLLFVMNFPCSSLLHGCATGPDTWNIRFYDIGGANARHPKLISTYHPPAEPHEMFLWVDPKNPFRALLYLSTPNGTTAAGASELQVLDISHAREGVFPTITAATFTRQFKTQAPAQWRACGGEGFGIYVHSMAPTADGRRLYLAYNCGEMLVADSSQVAAGAPHPRIRLLTPIPNRPTWTNPHGHSAVPVPGRSFVLMTDEVYGSLLTQFDPPAEHDGCPWQWVRLINVENPARPSVAGQYKITQDTPRYCRTAGRNPRNNRFTSFTSHNPTVLPDLAFVTWHSGGLQAIGITHPNHPLQAGYIRPRPLRHVATEDPALSSGNQKTLFWTYPIIKDGLIYAGDIRNGLYILRYTGPHADEVHAIRFLEGNSNLGDAVRLSNGS